MPLYLSIGGEGQGDDGGQHPQRPMDCRRQDEKPRSAGPLLKVLDSALGSTGGEYASPANSSRHPMPFRMTAAETVR
jgi:hypothetical protein